MDINNRIKNSTYSAIVAVALGLQHVIVLFVGIILTPVMLAQIYGFSADEKYYIIFVTVLGAAFSTLLQALKNKHVGLGSPMFMSTTGAFMSCAHAAIKMGGFSLFCSMALLATPFQILFSYGIRYMRHLLTPTVGGVIIMLAMVGLLKDSVNTWGNAGLTPGDSEALNLLVGFTVITIMILIEWLGRNRLRPWGLFLGITAGTILEVYIDGIDLTRVVNAPWFGLPPLHLQEFSFDPGNLSHWATYFTFVVSIQVICIKYVGDAMALQRIEEPDNRKTNFDAIQSGLYANSISMALTSLAGGMPSSSHSPNIPLMEMTGVVSRRIAVIATFMLVILIFSPKTSYLFAAIPGEVMGAVGVVLVAHLFSTGMRMVVDELDYRTGVIAGLSLSFGLIASNPSFFPNAFPEYIRPLTGNGVAVGGLVAVAMTILTRLSLQHNKLFYVKPEHDKISFIKNEIHNFAGKLGMERTQANYLELACEEIFVHALSELERKKIKGQIRYKVYTLNNNINVEISFGSRLNSDLDRVCNIPNKIEHIDEKDLRNLGLILLGRVVNNITHQNMGDYTYICFSLPIS